MKILTKISAYSGAAAIVAACLAASPASAQATRTWVSGTGDDANPCSRTAPCKTYAGAISRTASGGEINCIDAGGFGAVTITKAIAIICDNTESSPLQAGAGQSGIVVNAGPNDVVFLSGLDIEGSLLNSPAHGIRFLAGGSLYVQNSIIRGFNDTNGDGITFTPSGASQLFVTNTTIEHNSSGTTGAGIFIQPTGTGSARVALKDVRISNNANNGINVNTTGNTGAGVTVSVTNCEITGNTYGISIAVPASTTTAAIMVVHSTVSNNSSYGVVTNGANSTVRFSGSTISGNNVGVLAAGGSSVLSYGDNLLDGNPTVGAPNNGAFTGTVLPKK